MSPDTISLLRCPVCLTFALLTPNSIGNTFVPWVDHMHDMVTLGGKANTKSLGTILSTDGWTDNLIPVTPPQLVARGYNYDKRLPSHSKYSFTFTLISIALKKMLFKCFTYKHYVPSLPPPPGSEPLPPGITKFTILVKAFLLYITMHLVSLKHVRL